MLDSRAQDLGVERNLGAEKYALQPIDELHPAVLDICRELQDRTMELAVAREEIERLAAYRQEVESLYATKTLRWLAPARRAYATFLGRRQMPEVPRRVQRRELAPVPPIHEAVLNPLNDADYRKWVDHFDTPDDAVRNGIRKRLSDLAESPLVSVAMPVHDPDVSFLRQAVDSVRGQIYENWELCIIDDASASADVIAYLDGIGDDDPRVKLRRHTRRGHISEATNSAVEMATGQWVAFLDHDDVLSELALAAVVLAAAQEPGAKLIYSDEDKLDLQGRRCQPYFKPDFDPLLLMGQNYLAHLRVVHRDVFDRIGGFRAGFEGSQDWDFHLRLAEVLSDDEVVHVPRVLYHWRIHSGSTAESFDAKPYAKMAATRAVFDHLGRTERAGTVVSVHGGWCRVKWPVPDPPKVSVIICTRDGPHLARCLRSLWSRSTYPNFDIVVVDNGSAKDSTRAVLSIAKAQGVKVHRDPSPFNFSALNNEAVRRASSDLLCLLNDDVEVITPDWLEEMVGVISQPDVGAVGAKLYYPSGDVQHAGVIVGRGGVAIHLHRTADRLDPGYFGRAGLVQQFSAVTAAAMLVRRDLFQSIGGFDERLAVAFNDVDFCLRLRLAGWKVAWTPFAELFHHESATRGIDRPTDRRMRSEIDFMEQRWGEALARDPFYNPNLDTHDGAVTLACPPWISPL